MDWELIEKHLVGLADLDDLIDRLSKDRRAPGRRSPSIERLLGRHRQVVLESGLAMAPTEFLESLKRRPALLRDLQWLIFAHGGKYWTDLIDQAVATLGPENRALIERVRQSIKRRPPLG